MKGIRTHAFALVRCSPSQIDANKFAFALLAEFFFESICFEKKRTGAAPNIISQKKNEGVIRKQTCLRRICPNRANERESVSSSLFIDKLIIHLTVEIVALVIYARSAIVHGDARLNIFMKLTAGILFPNDGFQYVSAIDENEVCEWLDHIKSVLSVGYVILNGNIITSVGAIPTILCDLMMNDLIVHQSE